MTPLWIFQQPVVRFSFFFFFFLLLVSPPSSHQPPLALTPTMTFATPTNLVPAQESAPAPEVASFNVKAGLAQMLKVTFQPPAANSSLYQQQRKQQRTDRRKEKEQKRRQKQVDVT